MKEGAQVDLRKADKQNRNNVQSPVRTLILSL